MCLLEEEAEEKTQSCSPDLLHLWRTRGSNWPNACRVTAGRMAGRDERRAICSFRILLCSSCLFL